MTKLNFVSQPQFMHIVLERWSLVSWLECNFKFSSLTILVEWSTFSELRAEMKQEA